jgi:GNAT superfamily N-acetyltransferase
MDRANAQRSVDGITYRPAVASDAEAIATLHADSWRRNYRGIYLDAYLDGDVLPERLEVWTRRLTQLNSEHFTIAAERNAAIVGFAHMVLDKHPQWGACLDNLHVRYDVKRFGIGTQLMKRTAQELLLRRPSGGLYLWVLEKNDPAKAFYEARDGIFVERETHNLPGGGTAVVLRYAWPDPATLTHL